MDVVECTSMEHYTHKGYDITVTRSVNNDRAEYVVIVNIDGTQHTETFETPNMTEEMYVIAGFERGKKMGKMIINEHTAQELLGDPAEANICDGFA